jgi:hypothetical protein
VVLLLVQEAPGKHLATQTFAASMSVAHDPANPNFMIQEIVYSTTGTQNGDSGIVNLNFDLSANPGLQQRL